MLYKMFNNKWYKHFNNIRFLVFVVFAFSCSSVIVMAKSKNKVGTLRMIGTTDEIGSFFSPQWAGGRLSYMVTSGKSHFRIYNQEAKVKNSEISIAGDLKGDNPVTYYSFAWKPGKSGAFAVLGGDIAGNLSLFMGEGTLITRKLVEFKGGGEGVRFSKLCWLPDGSGIVYSKNGMFFVVNTKGTPKAQRFIKAAMPYTLSAESWGEFNPQIPHILAFQINASGRDAVYLYNLKKQTIIKICDDEYYSACHPKWSPDGKKLVFLYNRMDKTKDLWVGKETVTENLPDEKPWGLWVVDMHSENSFSKPRILSGELRVSRKNITADFTPIAWTPDSKHVLFAGGESGGVALYSSDSETGVISHVHISKTVEVKEDGVVISWNVDVETSDISCSESFNGKSRLAFAGEVNLGELTSRILIKQVPLR